jgi:hypothetical protein
MDGAQAGRRDPSIPLVSSGMGRRASQLGRSRAVRSCGPVGIADPGGSSSKERRISSPPKGPGFLGNDLRPRVSRS